MAGMQAVDPHRGGPLDPGLDEPGSSVDHRSREPPAAPRLHRAGPRALGKTVGAVGRWGLRTTGAMAGRRALVIRATRTLSGSRGIESSARDVGAEGGGRCGSGAVSTGRSAITTSRWSMTRACWSRSGGSPTAPPGSGSCWSCWPNTPSAATQPIPVAIETAKGLLPAALRAAGYQLFPINPLAVSRYRDRYAVSRAKSDPGDALVLANILRTDRAAHRPLPADSELAAASGCWPAPSRTRSGIANRRRTSCGRYCASGQGALRGRATWPAWPYAPHTQRWGVVWGLSFRSATPGVAWPLVA